MSAYAMNKEVEAGAVSVAAVPDEAIITAKDVQVYYGDKQALKDISLDVQPRQVTSFIGRRVLARSRRRRVRAWSSGAFSL